MARGFKTGDRQKGTPNKATVAKRARAQEDLRLADERGITPLDIMLSFILNSAVGPRQCDFCR